MYANASFYGCGFASWQDTWYTGSGANTYAVDSIIYGQTDCRYLWAFHYIFNTLIILARPLWIWKSVRFMLQQGRGAHRFGSWFQSVTLANRACGGGITAWRGTPGTRNGVYIADSRIIRVSLRVSSERT